MKRKKLIPPRLVKPPRHPQSIDYDDSHEIPSEAEQAKNHEYNQRMFKKLLARFVGEPVTEEVRQRIMDVLHKRLGLWACSNLRVEILDGSLVVINGYHKYMITYGGHEV